MLMGYAAARLILRCSWCAWTPRTPGFWAGRGAVATRRARQGV